MKIGDYEKKTVDDLVTDPAFRSWVNRGGSEDHPFWKELMHSSTELREKIREAKRILVELRQAYGPVEVRAAVRAEAGFEELKARIEQHRQQQRFRSMRRRATAWTVVTSVILLVGSGVLFWSQASVQAYQEYVTHFGEQEEVQLPDGSIVVLNADSKLRTRKSWNNGHRELWLEGEAYFNVEKKPATQAKFTVHTPGLDVEVLGTSFNVRARREMTQVALDEGQVKLIRTGEGIGEVHTMVPGELADFDKDSEQLTIRKTETLETYTSWKEGILIFDEITVREACRRMEEVHGLDIRIAREEQAQLMIHKLSVPMDDAEVFIETIQALFADQLKVTYDAAGKMVRIE